ncbi:MAG: cupin domain-containing protein [Candidatus Nitrosocaldus sp.]|nr:cupin domain-containing protein [Candidatus Nitrosocaldus sp.]MDW7999589.1 cupin domain-containing protein [Candidatus Nitrosocaldus sp.]MDW8276018.1 cupin domain-containing protein [Candidatus Nitrosocaldus sp.]
MRAEAYNVNDVLNAMGRGREWCCTFLHRGSMDVGVLRLMPGEDDPQAPHVNDEVYYIIRGDGFIRIDGKDVPIQEGSVIFVPARARHKFHGNTRELIALYVFAGSDEDETG